MTNVGEMRVVVIERMEAAPLASAAAPAGTLLSNPTTEAASLPPSSATKPRTLCDGLVLARPRHREPVVE